MTRRIRANGRCRTFCTVPKQHRCDDNDNSRQHERKKKTLVHMIGEPDEHVARSGHRIVAAGSEWVTPPDAAECKPASTPRSVALERFDGIGGTTRIITACGR